MGDSRRLPYHSSSSITFLHLPSHLPFDSFPKGAQIRKPPLLSDTSKEEQFSQEELLSRLDPVPPLSVCPLKSSLNASLSLSQDKVKRLLRIKLQVSHFSLLSSTVCLHAAAAQRLYSTWDQCKGTHFKTAHFR